MSLDYEEAELKILKSTNRVMSHKTLAKGVGYSVRKVYYRLKGLIEKTLIQAEKFINSGQKFKCKYFLTEKGFKEKVVLSKKFFKFQKHNFYFKQCGVK